MAKKKIVGSTEVAGIYKRVNEHRPHNNVWDLRFKDANGGEYLTPAVLHTLDMIMGTKLYEDFAFDLITINALSDQTGVQVVTEHTPKFDLIHRLERLYGNIDTITELEIPSTCGQDSLVDLDGAKAAYKEFYEKVIKDMSPEDLRDDD